MGAQHPPCLAASERSPTACERKRGGGHPSHGGWRAWASQPPLFFPLLGGGIPSSVTGPFGPALWLRPQSVSSKSIIGNEEDIYFSGYLPVNRSSCGKSPPLFLNQRL